MEILLIGFVSIQEVITLQSLAIKPVISCTKEPFRLPHSDIPPATTARRQVHITFPLPSLTGAAGMGRLGSGLTIGVGLHLRMHPKQAVLGDIPCRRVDLAKPPACLISKDMAAF